MYVTADPRNSDNSSTYLVGGGQPSFLNMGMTTTWNVSAGIIVQVTSSDSLRVDTHSKHWEGKFAGGRCDI